MSSEMQAGKVHSPHSGNAPDEGMALNASTDKACGAIPSAIAPYEAEWKTESLIAHYDIRSGLSKPAKEFGLGYPFLTFKDVFYNFFAPEQLGDLVQSTDKERELSSVRRGDVFLTRTSETMHELGMSCVALRDYPDATFNGFCKRLRPKPDSDLVPEYVGYFLRGPSFRQAMLSMSTMSTRASLNNEMIARLEITYPPKEMQSQIAAILKSLDDRIALLRETNATLEAIAQALFKSWFVDFDPVHANAGTKQMINPASSPSDFVGDPASPLDSRLRGNDDLLPPELQTLFPATFTASPQGLVPEGWEWQALDEAYELNPKRNLKKGAVAKYLDMASVSTSGHTAESAINREFGSGTKFTNGDTLLARITPCLENGKTAFVDFLDKDETGWGSTEFIVMRPKAPLPAYHAYLLARFPVFREFAIQSMSGTSGRQRVQNDVLGRYMLAVPDSAVAELFGQTVEAMQQKIAANHQQAQTLATLRDILLPRLISGQLRMPEAEAALAEVV